MLLVTLPRIHSETAGWGQHGIS